MAYKQVDSRIFETQNYNPVQRDQWAREAGYTGYDDFMDQYNRGLSGEPDQQKAAKQKLINDITKIINDLEDKLATLPNVVLSQAELDAFLQKAIAEIKPWYEQRLTEVQAGIKEGQIRNAEDMLKFMRNTEAEISKLLAKYDIDQAKTEEDFINQMADITASRDEDIALKRDDWRMRLEDARLGQTKTGILTSGVGQKRLEDLKARQEMEEQNLLRQYGSQQTKVEIAKKYDLQNIQLARQQAEAERLNKIGTPEQQEVARAQLRQTLGIAEGQAEPSDLEMAQRRASNDITVYKPEELNRLAEERAIREESRFGEMRVNEEEQLRLQREEQRRYLEAEKAKKQRELERAYQFG